MLFVPLFLLAGFAAAYFPLGSFEKRGSFTGVATFNDFSSQGATVCGPKGGVGGAYGAAAGDLSPDISGGTCTGGIDMSKCAGQSPVGGYAPPVCPKGNCGKCYTVTNQGGMVGNVGGGGTSITVQIIDACPSTSASNFCKTDIPANQHCNAPGVNALDIDNSAYAVLTGGGAPGGNNLNVLIAETCCPGNAGCTPTNTNAAGSSSSDAPPAGSSSAAPQSQPKSGGTSSQPKNAKAEAQPVGSGNGPTLSQGLYTNGTKCKGK